MGYTPAVAIATIGGLYYNSFLRRKKMRKKVLSLALVTVMALSLAACGAKEEAAAPAAEPAKEAAAPAAEAPAAEAPAAEASGADVNGDGKVVIGYISKNIVDPFHAPINEAAQQALDKMKADGVIDDWTGILDGETDPNKQIDRANDCIAKGCDIVIMLPAESEASDPALLAMNDEGIKVLEVNSKTASCDTKAFAFFGSDDVQAGEMLANWVLENCKNGGKYIHCTGILGNSAQIDRGQGIENIMKDHPEFEKVGEPDTQWKGDLAANAATDGIAQYGDELVAIICDNDDMSSAAQRACNDAGRKDIVCVGVDGNQNPLQMVKDGELGATVLQDGIGQVMGAIEAIQTMVNGGEVKSNPQIPFVLVTKDNVDQYLK